MNIQELPVEHCGGNHQATPDQPHEWTHDGQSKWCPGTVKVAK
jgi:hypothetical protein